MKKLLNVHFNVTSQAAVFVITLFILHSSFSSLHSQNVAINATGNQADPSAMLDVSSQTAGVLIPRMSTATRNAISSPATGLQVFNTDCNELNFWNGVCWISMGSIPEPHPITSSSATSLCAAVSATYSITAVTGATGYDWTVPAGATINSGQGTTSVSVTWGNYSGDICVDAYDACESSDQRCLDINVNPIPPTPGNITGLASVSPGQNSVSYFIASVSGASVYNWSVPAGATIVTGVGTPAITVNYSCSAVSGNVSVTAGSNCGNSSPASLAVSVIPLSVNAGSAVFGGSAIGGSPTASAGQTPYVYSWSPNSNLSGYTVANPTALCSGSSTTYTITVTDAGGCTATSSVAVTRNLSANAGSAVFGGATIGGSPTATGGNSSSYTYVWSPNNNLSSYSVANPSAQCNGSTTTYTVTVSDANGCTATSGVLVTRNLAVNAGSNKTICSGSSIPIGPAASTGGNSGSYSYSWSPSTGLSNPVIANPAANPSSTTIYTVMVTDSNGCTATSSMTVNVKTIPSTPGTISGSNSVCPSSSGNIYSISAVASATSYNWTVPSGASITSNTGTSITVTFGGSVSGNITVSATDSCGTSSQSTLSISQASFSASNISATNATITTANGHTIYTFTSSGTFVVNGGCSGTVSYLVVGGGGSGGDGNAPGGGGGAGGVVIGTLTVNAGTYSVTVGAGGGTSGTQNCDCHGNPGQNSSFGSITAYGGGQGGGYNSPNGGSGGSGGGGSGPNGNGSGGSSTQTSPSGGTGYGNSGASWISGGNWGIGGGGGGAGGPGGNPAGGVGISSSISGSAVTYGQGGNGGPENISGAPAGTGANGAANTGNGGGGSADAYQGSGGSGIVIISL